MQSRNDISLFAATSYSEGISISFANQCNPSVISSISAFQRSTSHPCFLSKHSLILTPTIQFTLLIPKSYSEVWLLSLLCISNLFDFQWKYFHKARHGVCHQSKGISRHIPRSTGQYGFFTERSPSSVPHQKMPKGFQGLQFAVVVTNAGLLCDSFAPLRKSSGPWRLRQGPVTTVGRTEQVLLEHHFKVHFFTLPFPVHTLKVGMAPSQ